MYDIYIAEAMIENDNQTFSTPEQKEALIKQVFSKHKVTQAQWDTSISWYSEKIELYLKMNDSVKTRLQREQKILESQLNRQFSQQQSASMRLGIPSYLPPVYSFREISSQNGLRFKLDSTEIASKIIEPDFEFSFDVIGISPEENPDLKSFFMLEYRDTTIYFTTHIAENKTYKNTGQKYINNDTLQHITGFVNLQNKLARNADIQLYNIFLGTPAAKPKTEMQSEDKILQMNEREKVNKPENPKTQ